MLSEAYDEEASDAKVIANLQNEIKRLRSKCVMILANKSGQLYRVREEDAEQINEDERVKLLVEAQAEVDMLSAVLDNATWTHLTVQTEPTTRKRIIEKGPTPCIFKQANYDRIRLNYTRKQEAWVVTLLPPTCSRR